MKLEGEAIYTASKAALENLTISMSRELSNFALQLMLWALHHIFRFNKNCTK